MVQLKLQSTQVSNILAWPFSGPTTTNRSSDLMDLPWAAARRRQSESGAFAARTA